MARVPQIQMSRIMIAVIWIGLAVRKSPLTFRPLQHLYGFRHLDQFELIPDGLAFGTLT